MRAKVYFEKIDVNGAINYSYPIDMKQVQILEYRDNYVIVDAPASLGLEPDNEEEIAKKLKELKQQRNDMIAAPLNGFDVATPEDRENIAGAIEYFDQLSVDGFTMWTMADNTEKAVSLADLKGAKDGYVLRKALAFREYQQKKAEVLS